MKNFVSVPASAGTEWSSRRVGRCATQLFLFCFIAYACSYLGRKNFSACIPAMIDEGFITKALAGTVTTAYMLSYGAGQILNGIIGSKIRPKYMIAMGLGGAGLCNLLMGFIPTANVMPLVWAFNGLFNSMLWAPIIRVFTDLLPIERRSSAGANIAPSSSIGAVLAFLLPGLLLKIGHWRLVFYVSGGILIACLIVWLLGNQFLRKYIAMMENACQIERAAFREHMDEEAVLQARKQKSYSLPATLIASGLWVVLFGLLCNGALRDAVETWAPTFLAEQFSIDSAVASVITVIIPVVSVAGTYVANWLYERVVKNELFTAVIMFLTATVSLIGLYLCQNQSAVICALCMAISISTMWGANHMFLTTVPYHFAPLGMTAAVTGLLNGIIYFATAVCSGLYGFLAENYGWEIMMSIWIFIGLAGMISCAIAAKYWKRKQIALDEGNI